ncbi:hypothetical protein P353_09905 [Comamonas testosteroni]|uniref:Uncharacterized protein n=1 Tax=Comamonas testosteroni TaxID=285 RepID=A0A096FLF6_COMTE|nr:hypothetical protein P353_09905 [Comamonas testosteroni]
MFVAAVAFEHPALAQGFVGKAGHGPYVASLQGAVGLLEFFDDADPGALGTVGSPDMHAQGARRAAGLARSIVPDSVCAVAATGLFADPGAGERPAAGQVVGLGDALQAMRAAHWRPGW